MEHVVFFSQAPGEPEFRRVGDLEEAVQLVERLRNERGISEVTLHALTPVPVSFRTYYRVEIGGADGAPVAESAVEVPADEVSVDEVSAVEVSAVELAVVEVLSAESVEAEVAEVAELAELAEVPEVAEVPDVEVSALELASLELAAEERVDGSPLALLPPPIEVAAVFDLGEPAEAEEPPVVEFEVVDEAPGLVEVSGELEGSVDEFDAFASLDGAGYEPLVPQVRPEPEVERSLGYFAS